VVSAGISPIPGTLGVPIQEIATPLFLSTIRPLDDVLDLGMSLAFP